MALGLTTGGGTVSLVQQSAAWAAFPASASLPAPSTAGNCLILIAFKPHGSGTGVNNPWTLLQEIAGGDNSIGVYAYPNNPGGIQITQAAYAGTYHLSEWVNVSSVATVDSKGTATSTSGTTLAPTTTGNLGTTGDLALSMWVQEKAGVAAVTFTTPAGFTRLSDTGADATVDTHVDVEYKINPATGAPLGPTLTSTATTTFAAGLIVVLKPAPPAVTQTSYLKYGSMTLKLNTFDFALQDPASVPLLGYAVTLTNPAWSGLVMDITQSDVVDRATGHQLVTIAATNAAAAPGGAAPGGLSDNPNGTTTFGYSGLSVKSTQNQNGPITVYGKLTTYTAGFLAGMTFALTSSNLGYSATNFVISNVTTTWQGLQQPVYLIEFGDVYPTLLTAGGGVLVQRGATAAILPARHGGIGGGTLGSAVITTAVNGLGNNVDITGLAVTVQSAASRRVRIEGSCPLTKHTVGLLALNLLQDGTQIAQWLVTGVDATGYLGHVTAIVVPAAGAHTYKLQVGNSAGTADAAASATTIGYLLVEDVGI